MAKHWRVFARLTGGVVLVVSAMIPAAPVGAATSPVVVAAGDIACAPGSATTTTTCNQKQTAALVTTLQPRYVAALGDLVYPGGSSTGFTDSYGPSWGKFKSIT
jgi:hypothetical protein